LKGFTKIHLENGSNTKGQNLALPVLIVLKSLNNGAQEQGNDEDGGRTRKKQCFVFLR
jgi:hypothetical protein